MEKSNEEGEWSRRMEQENGAGEWSKRMETGEWRRIRQSCRGRALSHLVEGRLDRGVSEVVTGAEDDLDALLAEELQQLLLVLHVHLSTRIW